MKIEEFIIKDNKKMRLGYTTGTCATAASKAAIVMLLSHQNLKTVSVMTPKGILLTLDLFDIVIEDESVSCAICKDSGDDPDVTNGMLIYSKVTLTKREGIHIEGGLGIGRVTMPGLNQPVGAAAINSVPRQMIESNISEIIEDYGYEGGVDVVISAPDGVTIAQKTFNSKLGIVGGISILGTSGIVEPMSDRAIVDTIRTELNVKRAMKEKYLFITPGNYGETFIQENFLLSKENTVKCSNFIGETLEYALECGFEGVLLIGHIGKLVKLAGGIMNTHSRYGDCRFEIFATHAALCGAEKTVIQQLQNSVTTEEMITVLEKVQLRDQVMQSIMSQIEAHMNAKVYGKLIVGAITFSTNCGLLGMTSHAHSLILKESHS